MTEGAADTEGAFVLRALQEGDSFKSLSSGDERFNPLKTFANRHARKYESANLARTYVVVPSGSTRVIAYITLVCSEVSSDRRLLTEEEVTYTYPQYPAMKIARLLVDSRHRKTPNRFGETLVDLAMGIARTEICPAVGCRFVVVDSKKESIKFYERCGFTLLDTETNRDREEPVMFIDLHKAAS